MAPTAATTAYYNSKESSDYIHIKLNKSSPAKMKGEESQTYSSTTNSSLEENPNKNSKCNGLKKKKLGEEDKYCCVFDEDDRMNPRKPT